MNADLIIEAIFNWEYIWWVVLFSYILISEAVYFVMCKFNLGEYYDGEEYGWFTKKIVSFGFGIMIVALIVLLIIFTFATIDTFCSDPIGHLKGMGKLTLAIIGIVLFFFANYKIWERYN